MTVRVRRVVIGSGLAMVIAMMSLVGAWAQAPSPSNEQLAVYATPGVRFSFGLWGDMPYTKSNDGPKMPALLADMNGARLAFSIFVGDIKDGSSRCDPVEYTNAIALFNSFSAPVVYIPGDNEWTDCHRTNNGGFNNLERLEYLRRTMFPTLMSFGQRQMLLEHQGAIGAPYVENVRWTFGDVVFVGLNVPGSNNNKVNSERDCTRASVRTQADCDADNAEYAARDAANIAWLRQSFALARSRGAVGVMLTIQGDPGFDLPETEDVNERAAPGVDGYTNLLDAVIEETRAFSGQVVLVHGDTHVLRVDKPLVNQADLLQNFTRVQVFGSPNIHWVQVDVDPRSRTVFSVTPMLVPGN